MNRPRLITASTTEPILLAEAKLNLRAYSSTTEDSRITRLITAARQACEEEAEISLVQKTWEITQESFYPTRIELPFGPVRSIVSVYYLDPDGVDTLLAADQYQLDVYGTTETLITAYDVTLPDTRRHANSVRVRYTAGYPSTDSPPEEVPEPIRQAMHLLIAHYFEHREAVDDDSLMELPLGVKHLLGKYRRGLGV